MSQITISKLTFAYEGSYDNIFENVSFHIDTDWKLGFTGRNGRGKTTFLHLLLGKYEYRGTIMHDTHFTYFPFQVEDDTADTLSVIRGVNASYLDWQLLRELSLLEIDDAVLYRPFNTLSQGEQTKVLLAALFLQENNFLLIDEPTNHLDLHGRELVANYLNQKRGFILVSHDRNFLDGCIDHVLAINKTNIEIVQGNFSSWLTNKERQDSFELAKNNKLQGEIKRLGKTAKEKASWSDKVEKSKYATRNSGSKLDRGYVGHKSAKMMKRAKGLEIRQKAATEEKAQLLKNIESAASLKINQISYHADSLVSLRDIAIFYGENVVCQNISFTIDKGDRIALQGKNGSGKSSILKMICGENIPYSGELHLGSNLQISYVSQDTESLSGNLADFARANNLEESLLKTNLIKLGFDRKQFDKDISAFSGGQKKKVLIAKSLCQRAHLYLWDEPLNFIDVISRMQIEELFLKFKPTILFVEHDSAFCSNIATKNICL